MKPAKIIFYVYIENESQAKVLEETLYNFVARQYEKGVLVTAEKLTALFKKYGNNILAQAIK